MQMTRRAVVARFLSVMAAVVIMAGWGGPAGAQPLPFGRGGSAGPQWSGGERPWAGGGRIAATGVLLVQMKVEQGCTIKVVDGLVTPPSCGGPIPWMANLVSDDDPDFSEAVAFETDAKRSAKPDLARVTAMRFTVDY